MASGINMLCFSASYALALAIEATGLWRRGRWHRAAVGSAALAGVVAHAWYLSRRAGELPGAPLSSPHDWYLLAAWLLAAAYLCLGAYYPRRSFGLFLLPATLVLSALAAGASRAPLSSYSAPRLWGVVHAALLLGGTVAVLIGFVAGLMYLLQSRRLKRKIPPSDRFRLPSLEWLESATGRALTAAVGLVALGFIAGIVMRIAHKGSQSVPWSDPTVLSLAAMTAWLAAAETFRRVYPAANHGRKMAYLTLAAGVFLAATLWAFVRPDEVHRRRSAEPPAIGLEGAP